MGTTCVVPLGAGWGGHTGNQAGWGPDSSSPWTYMVIYLGTVPLLLRYIKRLLDFPIMSISFAHLLGVQLSNLLEKTGKREHSRFSGGSQETPLGVRVSLLALAAGKPRAHSESQHRGLDCPVGTRASSCPFLPGLNFHVMSPVWLLQSGPLLLLGKAPVLRNLLWLPDFETFL